MSESKHTPGPWEAYNTTGAGWSVRKQHERPGYEGLAPICSMAWWQFDIPGIIDDEISEANARLIAAAPSMLNVLQAVSKELRTRGTHAWFPVDVRIAVDDVIARAEGTAQ